MSLVKYRPVTEDDKTGAGFFRLVVKKRLPDGSGFYPDRFKSPANWQDGNWFEGNGRIVDEEVIGIEID